jgi:uncharacterized protein (TIGR00255 family)
MIQSMTGFASQTLIVEQSNGQNPIHLTINIKSLNSRFFEINCKIPSQLTSLEVDIIKQLKNSLYRGQIYVTIHLHNPNSLIAEISADTQTVTSYINAIKAIQASSNLPGELRIEQIIRLPNVFNLKENELDEQTKQQILGAINQLELDLLAARNQEGLILEQDLRARTNNMQTLIQEVIGKAAQNITIKKADMIAKVEQFAKDIQDESLLENQKAYMHNALDKLDVHEEITRFCGHLKKLNEILNSQTHEKGKTLDFTLQECNREINTIAAKASCLEINTIAIEVKIEIEKMRQQVQNII